MENTLPLLFLLVKKSILAQRIIQKKKNVSNINDFSKLPIPFMCSVNLETGKLKF